ncbi:MAG: hypothetical protein LBR11_11820 [Deltaproteobacteria bacterium]|jgi:hypothetical protein|nr:hypothetical protein [Deltaproteobacteria bacterium]
MVSIFLAKQPSLRQLVRRLLFYFSLALLGSWGLIIPRLFIFHLDPASQASNIWLYLDLISLALVIFGVFMVIYNNSLLKPRLQRLIDLGEAQW